MIHQNNLHDLFFLIEHPLYFPFFGYRIERQLQKYVVNM